MTLSSLLDYRQDDNKEGTFEGKISGVKIINILLFKHCLIYGIIVSNPQVKQLCSFNQVY